MSFQVRLLIVLVAALAALVAAADHPMYVGMGGIHSMGQGGLVADSIEHLDQEMMMESDTARRQLGSAGYISYTALARNRVPCGQPGTSYYNCRGHQRANPYSRGCTRATSCARTTR